MDRTLKGFTLIELMVVTAIIAIPAVLLFPVFANAQSAYISSACMGNVSACLYAYYGNRQDSISKARNLDNEAGGRDRGHAWRIARDEVYGADVPCYYQEHPPHGWDTHASKNLV